MKKKSLKNYLTRMMMKMKTNFCQKGLKMKAQEKIKIKETLRERMVKAKAKKMSILMKRSCLT